MPLLFLFLLNLPVGCSDFLMGVLYQASMLEIRAQTAAEVLALY